MQTFLPYPDFAQSAQCLDNKRLGKQRVECVQMLIALATPDERAALHRAFGYKSCAPGAKPPYSNHPCTLTWRGYEWSLFEYMIACCREWDRRAFDGERCWAFIEFHEPNDASASMTPPWLGDSAFHASHRAALLHKDPDWYAQFNWSEQPALDYVWPNGKLVA